MNCPDYKSVFSSFSPHSTITPVHLYGICGNAGAGKDTFAEIFHSYKGFLQYSFALPVKQVVCAAFGISLSNCFDRDYKELEIPYWHKSPRELMQYVGTELFRKHFGTDFWIRRLQYQMFLDSPLKVEIKAVISDVRFQNEAQWILDSGGSLIHLTRPEATGNVGIPNHASEAGIDFEALIYPISKEVQYALIENTGTIQQLQWKAQAYIENKLNFDYSIHSK